MNIRMYDCGFGDCFRLEGNNLERLYVDFGISLWSMNNTGRHSRYDLIISQIPDNSDFLLTHYHEDHYEGAVHMVASGKRFRDVYIPDIWKINGSVDVVLLLLFSGLIKKGVLARGLSLIQFLISICSTTGKVHFVKRGSEIQDEYVALWPDEDYINQRTKKIIDDLYRDADGFGRLVELSRQIITVVLRLEGAEGLEAKQEIVVVLQELEEQYKLLSNEINIDKVPQYKLSKYGNEISIVFQNKLVGVRNVLFTGDVGKDDVWDLIEGNYDGKIPMHDKYHVIKIPHHGTNGYYHSFVARCNSETVFLIPNGRAYFPTWYSDARYSIDANSEDCLVVCSDNRACNAVNTMGGRYYCNCTRCLLANNSVHYIDI